MGATCVKVVVGLISIVVLLFGIFLLLPFPLDVFPAIVKSQLPLKVEEDGQFTTITHYWAQFPVYEYYNFYMWNVTNPDEVLYNGEQARIQEIGPYVFSESEFKEEIDWRNDGTVYFKNNKTWRYRQDLSCERCAYEDSIMLPNAAYMAVVSLAKAQHAPPLVSTVLDILTLLLGESPLRHVPVQGVLFESYSDPFINLVNSDITHILMKLMGGKLFGMTLPDVPAMGYFPHYNHTHDEDYTALTGETDVYKSASLLTWAGNDSLSWWGDNYSRNISGCSDGSFQKAQIDKDYTYAQFQSFGCRAFRMHYDSEESVSGIHSYVFKMNDDEYDTTLVKNQGYRYENYEKKDYFPNWPCGLNHTYTPSPDCAVDCSLAANFCDRCCDGSHYHAPDGSDKKDTVFIPPGIIPLRCLPGQNKLAPFPGFLSPPHFLQSPKEVTESMFGLRPDPVKHEAARFNLQPLTGATVQAQFRMQLSVPLYQDDAFLMLNNLRSTFFPTFWVTIDINMKNYALDFIRLSTATVPKIALGVGIVCCALPIIVLVVCLWCRYRQRKQRAAEKFYLSKIEEEQCETWRL